MSKPKNKPRIRVTKEAILKRKHREEKRLRDLNLIGDELYSLHESEMLRSINLDIKGHLCYPIYKEDAEQIISDIFLWCRTPIEFARNVNAFYRSKWDKAAKDAMKRLVEGISDLQTGLAKAVSDAFAANKNADWSQLLPGGVERVKLSGNAIQTGKSAKLLPSPEIWKPEHGEIVEFIRRENSDQWTIGFYLTHTSDGMQLVETETKHVLKVPAVRKPKREAGSIETLDMEWKPKPLELIRAYVRTAPDKYEWGEYVYEYPHSNKSTGGHWVTKWGHPEKAFYATKIAPIRKQKVIDHSNDGIGSAIKDLTPDGYQPKTGDSVMAYITTISEKQVTGEWVKATYKRHLKGKYHAVSYNFEERVAEIVAPVFQFRIKLPEQQAKTEFHIKDHQKVTTAWEPALGEVVEYYHNGVWKMGKYEGIGQAGWHWVSDSVIGYSCRVARQNIQRINPGKGLLNKLKEWKPTHGEPVYVKAGMHSTCCGWRDVRYIREKGGGHLVMKLNGEVMSAKEVFKEIP